MNFPFLPVASYEDGGIVGQTFTIYNNKILTNSYEHVEKISFLAGGDTVQGWHWRVDEGILYLTDDVGTLQFSFNGVEIVNGRISAVGMQLGNGAIHRVVMHETVPIRNDWQIRVSSCLANKNTALPSLLKSLRRESVSTDDIKVVVGSVPYAEAFEDTFSGIRHMSDERNLKGFTGMLADKGNIKKDVRYVLLHDTCKVQQGFREWLTDVDVGLNPDIILFRPPSEGLEMGIYSGDFLLEQDDLEVLGTEKRLSTLIERADVVMTVGGTRTIRPPEDHYGEKKLRQEVVMSKPRIVKMKSFHTRKSHK